MARQLDSVLGHNKTIEKLTSSIATGSLFTSAIFTGPEGVGKKKVAISLSQEANCARSPACGHCAECVRFSMIPNEGYLLLEPENGKIKIEQVRDVIDYLSLRSRLKDRFIIINEAEKLTPQAANALLKSIEEPPQGVHFILVTSNLAMLLPTIRSRCQVVSFSALSTDDLKKMVPGLEDWQAEWSFGRVTLAQKIIEDEWQQLRKTSINFLHRPLDGNIFANMAREFSDNSKFEYIFHTWMTYLRDAMVSHARPHQHLYNRDIESYVHKFADHRNLQKNQEALFTVTSDYLGNVDKNLILENLALALES
ncbi:MAG: AAA family ATPase [Bdellovibrionaceae bacterium]|nr:AAA family ATPase [Pseudobdellovibrionaceae bacterium]